MNIFQFQNLVSRRLLRWAGFSIVAGLLMRTGSTFWKSVGAQFIGWGAVDAAIAIGGQVGMRNRVDRMENPGLPEIHKKEEANLSRLLWLNFFLDIGYIIGGLLWMRRDKGDGEARGTGIGVVIQGAFLLLFDLIHALNTPKTRD